MALEAFPLLQENSTAAFLVDAVRKSDWNGTTPVVAN